MDYAKNLKLARKWAGMTQKELAERTNLATITIHQYEAGKRKPTMENWFTIANVLHLSLDELNNAELLPTVPFDPDAILEEEEADRKELERLLVKSFSKLNMNGQHEAVKRVNELTEIRRYRRRHSPTEAAQPPSPAPEGKDTPEQDPPPEAPKTGE